LIKLFTNRRWNRKYGRRKPHEAITIDTSHSKLDEVVQRIVSLAKEKINN